MLAISDKEALLHYSRSLIEATLDPLTTLDMNGNIMDVNVATELVTGRTRDILVDTCFAQYFTEPMKARLAFERVVSAGDIKDHPLSFLHASGTVTDVLCNATLYRYEAQTVIGILVAARDVTQLNQAQREIENVNREIQILGQMTDLLQSCQWVSEAYPVIMTAMMRLFPGASGSCFVYEETGNFLEEVSAWGKGSVGEKLFSPDLCWGMRRGRLHQTGFRFEQLRNPRCQHVGTENEVCICVPLLTQGKVLGLISLIPGSHPEAETGLSHRLHLVQTAADSISLAFANLKLREHLQQLSFHDSLTGLFNRRFMAEALTREIKRVALANGTLTVAMLDIDHFKHFNDQFGHDAGDAVLKGVADLMMDFREGGAIPCRFGGEEFLMILPDMTQARAVDRLERFRESIGALIINHTGHNLPPVTLSIGVAVFPAHGRNTTALIKSADKALYLAKTHGRDRLEVADAGD